MFRQEVLEGCLTPEQRAKGFSLEEDDHCLYLLYKGKRDGDPRGKPSLFFAQIQERRSYDRLQMR